LLFSIDEEKRGLKLVRERERERGKEGERG